MKDEKKIMNPERKRAVSASRKKSASEKKTIASPKKREASDGFKIDLVSEIKSVRKTKTAEKSTIRKTAKRSKSLEISEIIAAEAKPRTRKTPSKESETIVNSKTAAKKAAPKTAAKKTVSKATRKKVSDVMVAAAPEKDAREIETAKKSKILPQAELVKKAKILPKTEISAESKNVLSSKIETMPAAETDAEKSPVEEESPLFKELAAPKLPALQPENRARLQMQSPTRVFFYWSLKSNPFETLQKVFGGRDGNYSLIVKLQNQTDGTEKVVPIDSSGSAWFDVESGAEYRAEVGFSAPHRPFIRLMFSNTIETPRSEPATLFDHSPQFAVTPQQFAEVLDVSGYRQNAFEIVLTGDDAEVGNAKTFAIFEQLTGEPRFETKAAELRLVLFALASGLSLDDLRDRVSANLLVRLEKITQENAARLSAEKVLSALEENFGLGNLKTEDALPEISSSVFGASLINFQKFPKQVWKKFAPISSSKIAGSFR